MGHESLMLDDEGLVVDVLSIDVKKLLKLICACELEESVIHSVIKCMEEKNILQSDALLPFDGCHNPDGSVFLPKHEKKHWKWDYLYKLVSLTNNSNSASLYRHIDEVVRHLKKIERSKTVFKNCLSTIIFCAGMVIGIFAPLVIAAKLYKASEDGVE